MIYHVMKDFHLCSWLPSYDLSKISAKLAISLKHKISFAEFLDILFDNSVTSSLTSLKKKNKLTHISLTKQKSFGSHLSLYFSIFY